MVSLIILHDLINSFITPIVFLWRWWEGIHKSPVDFPHKGSAMQNAFPCHDSTMWRSLVRWTAELIMPRWLSMADPTSGYFTWTEALLSLTGMGWRWLQFAEEKTYKVLMLIMTRYSVQIRDWNSSWHGAKRPQQPWWISRNFLMQVNHGCIDMSVQDLEKLASGHTQKSVAYYPWEITPMCLQCSYTFFAQTLKYR